MLRSSWSYQLHFDNLAVVAEQQPQAGPMPSYVSLLRSMKSHGLSKRVRRFTVRVPKRLNTVTRPGKCAATRANMPTGVPVLASSGRSP